MASPVSATEVLNACMWILGTINECMGAVKDLLELQATLKELAGIIALNTAHAEQFILAEEQFILWHTKLLACQAIIARMQETLVAASKGRKFLVSLKYTFWYQSVLEEERVKLEKQVHEMRKMQRDILQNATRIKDIEDVMKEKTSTKH